MNSFSNSKPLKLSTKQTTSKVRAIDIMGVNNWAVKNWTLAIFFFEAPFFIFFISWSPSPSCAHRFLCFKCQLLSKISHGQPAYQFLFIPKTQSPNPHTVKRVFKQNCELTCKNSRVVCLSFLLYNFSKC